MVKQADSGAWSILAAIAAALTPVMVKSLMARRKRAPDNLEEQAMCRNHSHVTGVLLQASSEQEYTAVKIVVTQQLTLELLSGEKLIVPPYSVCYVMRDGVTQSLGSLLHAMAVQGDAELFKDDLPTSFGPTIPPK